MPIRILQSAETDPWFNLATEDYIFRDMDPSAPVLFLWRNRPNIVIGRHQNPWVECDLEAMEAQGVQLTRRQSGGGAVYQDLGNTCFTFLSGKDAYSKQQNFDLLLRALAVFGIEGEISGRNDLLVDGRKVSGSAFKETRDRAFHHGTMLLDTDLGRLGELLRPDPRKLTAKGIKSVRSRVANLTEFAPSIDHDSFCEALADVFRRHHGEDAPLELLDRSEIEQRPALRDHYEQQKDWNWRFGETPRFDHHLTTRFEWGLVDVHLDANKGMVTGARIYSDSLLPDMIDTVADLLQDVPYRGAAMRERILAAAAADGAHASEMIEIAEWLAREVG